MLEAISALLRSLLSGFQSHSRLALENLALRHRLTVLNRQAPKPKLRPADRLRDAGWIIVRVAAPFGDPDWLGAAVGAHEVFERTELVFKALRGLRGVIVVDIEHIHELKPTPLHEVAGPPGIEVRTEATDDHDPWIGRLHRAIRHLQQLQVVIQRVAELLRQCVTESTALADLKDRLLEEALS